MRDRIYTPGKMADEVIAAIGNISPRIIADFCCGEGSLLISARQKWPKARIFASDIDGEAVRKVGRKLANVSLSILNFMDSDAREKSTEFKNLLKSIDLILLNPPFSTYANGKNVCSVAWGRKVYKCSPGVYFLCESLRYLNERNGVLAAIMPDGAMHSLRDMSVLSAIRRSFNIQMTKKFPVNSFVDCSPSTGCWIVSSKKSDLKFHCDNRSDTRKVSAPFLNVMPITLIRGSNQMHRVTFSKASRAVPLFHTAQIDGFSLLKAERMVISRQIISGPSVLLSRVCNPKSPKVGLMVSAEPFAISDCLFALTTERVADARRLHKLICDNWSDFKGMYSGTGAQYTTLSHLERKLRYYGAKVTVSASRPWSAPVVFHDVA
jgi:16S rRNA G966 N2-methylase RsmD